MENQDKKKILNKIVEDFKTVGFSKEQILKLLNTRQKEKEESLPFLRVNIQERFSLFEKIFSDSGVSKEDMYNALSDGIVFSYLPASLSDLLSFIQGKGADSKLFLKEMSSTAHGRAVLAWGPKKIKSNINESLVILDKYKISMRDFIVMAFKYPNILKINPKNLDTKLVDFIEFAKSHGVSFDESISVLKKMPDILVKDIETLKQKCSVVGDFVQKFGVQKQDWVDACFSHPKLFCKDVNALIQNITTYQENFEKGVFCFSQHPDADKKHLMKYLLSSPQYICISPSNVKERMLYAQQLLARGKKATTAVLYLSKAKMQKNLKDLSKQGEK